MYSKLTIKTHHIDVSSGACIVADFIPCPIADSEQAILSLNDNKAVWQSICICL